MKTQEKIEEFIKKNKGVTIDQIMDAVPYSYEPSAYRYRLNKLRKLNKIRLEKEGKTYKYYWDMNYTLMEI